MNNLEQFYTSVEKLRAIATKSDATMVFGMTPTRSSSCVSHPPGATADGCLTRYRPD